VLWSHAGAVNFRIDASLTAREQRVSKDATADEVGKALKAKNPMGGCGVKQSHKVQVG
jgi:hypothetical protein